MYEYDLFAVINHEGQIDNGHYTNFARFQDEVSLAFALFLRDSNRDWCLLLRKWYRFDDDK